MTTHLYCLLPGTARGTLPDGASGIAGAPLRELLVGDLSAWVSDVEARQPVALTSIRAHDAAIATALSTGGATPIPARFGQRFPDDAACIAALAAQADALATGVAAVQGFVEMTLLVTPSTKQMMHGVAPIVPEMIEPGQGLGRRYLDALRARETAADALRDVLDSLGRRLSETVRGLVRRSVVEDSLDALPFRTISHLVERSAVDAYVEAARTVHPSAEYRVLIIGPRAPYTFSPLSSEKSMHGFRIANQP